MDWTQFNKGIFLLNVLGIVYDSQTRNILIGKRENDPHIKELSWCFPGGRPAYEKDIEAYLQDEIKLKTGLEIDVQNIVFAKTYPEKREFMSIYYLCEVTGGAERFGEKFVELRWVKPTDVQKYFTTSLHPKLLAYLKTLD